MNPREAAVPQDSPNPPPEKSRSSGMKTLLLAAGLAAAFATPAGAVNILNFGVDPDGPGGDTGFGTLAMGRNDDDSSNLLALPFMLNFFGTNYSNFYVNNNGNITFNDSVGAYTPEPFPISAQPMIAPFWGDVDTRCETCGEVYVASPNQQTVAVTWSNVGFYSSDSSKTNTFQLLLHDRSASTGNAGDFDIEFRYERLEWTTGDASDGENGLGGTPAQAGFDAGDETNFFVLPGSFTANVLDLQDTSNVGEEGRWVFAIRNGVPPGATPDNPILPVETAEGYDFEFGVVIEQQIFIDPIVAIGYDYIVNSGPNFQTVLLPTGIGDDLYELIFNGTSQQVAGGVAFDFGLGGVSSFRVLGIETAAGLDPNDPLAFVTGLTFAGAGTVNMSMNPITYDTDGQVPEPAALALLGLGLAGIASMRRRAPRA
jgi:hypothetical protein